MMNILSFAIDIILAAYIGREVVRFIPQYRQLKLDLAHGDTRARTRVYLQALKFEWISALMAVLALRFDWSKFNPQLLGLENSSWIQHLAVPDGMGKALIGGLFGGVALGGVVFAVARMAANRRPAAPPAPEAPPSWRSRLLPDFTALIPVTMRERWLWVVVALSAGVCEEVVFRGWLLATLHSPVGVAGTALIVAGAAIFGLAHLYQKAVGVIATGFAGLLFCILYVKTGSLLVPILLHCLIDVRFAILPAPRTAPTQTAYA